MQTRRFKVGKLVRDKMEAYMISKGVHGPYETLTLDQFIKELIAKLVEEAQEVASASSTLEVQKELADLLEVIHALHKAYGFDPTATEQIRQEKYERLGGFEKRFYVPYADIDAHNPFIENYLKQPHKYPEIVE